MPGATYRLPSTWSGPDAWLYGIDYAHIERKLARVEAEARLRAAPHLGDWIVWEANGRKLTGQVKSRRSSQDYEVYLLNPENHTHIVVVQDYEIVKVRASHLEVLAAST